MTRALAVGIEIGGDDVAGLLGDGLGGLPTLLDSSGASYVVVGADRAGDSAPTPSPTIIGTLLARATERIGIVVAASPQRDHPFNVARRVASLDHISRGRAGLLALDHDHAISLGADRATVWADPPLSASTLADSLLATRKLWRTWPVETLDPDPTIAARADLPFADHVGVFSTKGPLNVPTTPQGEPVTFWHLGGSGVSVRDELADATIADVLLLDAADADAVEQAAGLTDAVDPVHVHLRLPADGDLLDAVTAARGASHVTGVTLTPGTAGLTALVRDVLPVLAAAGHVVLHTAASPYTLRDRLVIPRRVRPDLSSHTFAFNSQGSS